MKKLKLNVDELVVESFESLPSRGAGRGTVVGHDPILFSQFDTCPQSQICPISDDEPTCLISQCGQPGCGGSADLVICP